MFRLAYCFSSVLLSISAFSIAADEPPLNVKEDAPQTYTVEKGDTLWDISELYLDSPWLWPRLWQVNPDVDNPHLIYPGDKLNLIWRDGQPVLSLKPMKKLSPKMRLLDKQAVPTIAEGLVLPYLQSDRLIDEDMLKESNRVLGTSDGRKYLTGNDRIYINGNHSHEQWGIYRPVAEYERKGHDKDAVVLKLIATAQLDSAEEELSALKVHSQVQEILLNDVVLPDVDVDSASLNTTFYPAPAKPGTVAKILGSVEGSKYMAINQVVVIDLGTKDGLRQGSMFNLVEEGTVIYGKQGDFQYEGSILKKNTKLPDMEVGSLMVIRPYEAFSLAIITDSKKPVSDALVAVSPLQEELEQEAAEVTSTEDSSKDAISEES